MQPWYKTKVKTVNETLDEIYEAQCEQAKDGLTPPVIRRDPITERYTLSEDSDDEGIDEPDFAPVRNYMFWGIG